MARTTVTKKAGGKRKPTPAGDVSARARRIYKKLVKLYPDADCALEHKDAFELLVATILSAQCTDARVNMVTPVLFKKYPTPDKMGQAPLEELEAIVKSTGFYRNKAKSIKGASEKIVSDHGGRVPQTMDELVQLPGVARKTANVVLGNAFAQNEGVVVDTHVSRLSQRLGLTKHTDPVKIERDLMEHFDRKTWTLLAHLLIDHGRAVCNARKPLCSTCTLADDCPKVGVKVSA
ncbi:MAG: endonuclease III [Phycisphaera sp.]|nr:endonuclease III [Phycisphaera sp.]